ncbi:MAG: hypothetical protein IT519_10080 [Burkholderiales bacterium]|nr:hypothetical protein [Burkholderiales bacterium]
MISRTHRRSAALAASTARRPSRAVAPMLPTSLYRHDRGTLACLGSAR